MRRMVTMHLRNSHAGHLLKRINLFPLFDLIKGLPPPPKRKYGMTTLYNISTWGRCKFSWWKQPLHSQIRNPISTMVPSEHLWSQGYYSSHTCACIISIGHALQVFFKWDFLFNWTLWRSDVSQMSLHHNLYRICMCPYTHLTMHSQTF